MELLIALNLLVLSFSLVCAIAAQSYARKAHTDSRTARLNADEISLLNNRVDLLQNALRRIEGRQVKVAALKNPSGEPDSKVDPDGWRLWKNRQLSMASNQKGF